MEAARLLTEEVEAVSIITTLAETRLMSLPAADVAPVVHGRWVKPKGMMPPEHHGHYECSECGAWAGRDWLRPWKEILITDFCPGCGAKMDGERREE